MEVFKRRLGAHMSYLAAREGRSELSPQSTVSGWGRVVEQEAGSDGGASTHTKLWTSSKRWGPCHT